MSWRSLLGLLAMLALAACDAPPGAAHDATVEHDATIVEHDAAIVEHDAAPAAADATPIADAEVLPDAAGPCSALPDGADCDDGDACTQVDECLGGACVGTTPIVCEAVDDCHVVGMCVPESGLCTKPARPESFRAL